MVEFRDAVAREIKRRWPNVILTMVDDGQISISGGPKELASVIFVDHFFGEVRTGAMTADEAKTQLLDGLSAPSPAISGDTVVLIVRPMDYIAPIAAKADKGWRVLHRPIGAKLEYFVAVDGEKSLSVPNSDELAKLNLGEERIWQLAAANIPKRMGRLKLEQMDVGAWTLTSPNDLGPSVMAVEAFWAKPPVPLKGPAAVAVIQRNLLVVVDSSEEATMARIKTWLTRLRTDPDTMSTALFLKDGAGWKEVSY
jgi:hypothetical protein